MVSVVWKLMIGTFEQLEMMGMRRYGCPAARAGELGGAESESVAEGNHAAGKVSQHLPAVSPFIGRR